MTFQESRILGWTHLSSRFQLLAFYCTTALTTMPKRNHTYLCTYIHFYVHICVYTHISICTDIHTYMCNTSYAMLRTMISSKSLSNNPALRARPGGRGWPVGRRRRSSSSRAALAAWRGPLWPPATRSTTMVCTHVWKARLQIHETTCMFVMVFMYICVCVCICLYICVCMYIYIYMYMRVCICVSCTCASMHKYVRMLIRMCQKTYITSALHLFLYIQINIHINIHIHVHIHINI